MSPSHVSSLQHPVRTLVCSALIGGALAFTLSAPANAAPRVATANCPGLDLAPTATNTVAIRPSILCLVNADRSQRGLAALRENPRLRSAAVAHSSDMIRQSYFSHTTPGGQTFVDRILGSGYTSRTAGWALGENLAWGTESLATPRGANDAWMHSTGHRANILKASYRDVGIGVRPGVPNDAGAGATYTTDFGVKR